MLSDFIAVSPAPAFVFAHCVSILAFEHLPLIGLNFDSVFNFQRLIILLQNNISSHKSGFTAHVYGLA
jgi:hypothetical protein